MRRSTVIIILAALLAFMFVPAGASAVPVDAATWNCLTKKFGVKAATAISKAKKLNAKQKKQLAACTKAPDNPGGGGTSSEFPFQNLTLNFASDPWQWSSAADLGPFQPIKIFGRTYNGHAEPALTFMMLKIGTPVIAPVNGKVLEVRDQPESKDAELYIMFDEATNLIFSVDHIKTTLKRGDLVKVGDVIANVPAWEGKETWGGYEFMFVKPEKNLAYCPVNLLDPKVADAAKADIRAVMEKWASTAGSAAGNPYKPEDFARGVCEASEVPLK